MDIEVSRVIVTTSASSSSVIVHHRDFPEIRAEGGSPKEAAAHLVNKLACAPGFGLDRLAPRASRSGDR